MTRGDILLPLNWHERLIHSILSSRIGAWFFSLTLHHLDLFLFHRSKGGVTLSSHLAALPVVMLTTTGARTGARRTVPLVGIEDGEKVIVIASAYGSTHHPAWYHNLRVNPEAMLSFEGHTRTYIGREATPVEYGSYWDRAVSLYKGYTAYRLRTGGRKIPIMVLTPK